MPRIPSAGNVSPIGAGASRLPTIRAQAEHFGVHAASGLKDLAGGVDAIGPLLEDLVEAWSKTETAKQTTEPGQHATAMRDAAIQMVDTWEFDGSSPEEAAARSSRALDALEERRLEGVAPEQRQRLKAASAPIRQGLVLRVAQRAQNHAVAALDRRTGETLELLQSQAVREPDAAAHYVAEGQGQLRALRAAGALTPEQFADQEQAFRRALLAKVVRSRSAVQAMADLADGVHDTLLDDAALKQALTEETAWRLHSETALAAAAAAAQLARVRRGEAAPGDLSASAQAVPAAADMADAELQTEIAFRVRSEMERLRFAPEAELNKRLEELAPLADAADAATRERIRQEVWTQGQAMLHARRADPAGYAMQQPAVAQAFAAATKDLALLPDAVAARLAAQDALGLTPEAQNALTLEERSQIRADLMRLPSEQRIAALVKLGDLYGDQIAAVAADLAEAGLTPAELLAADPSGGLEVPDKLAQAAQGQGEAKTPEGDVIGEAAERLIFESHRVKPATLEHQSGQVEDMEFSLPSSRPKPNPLREDESVEGRLHIPKLAGTPREQVQILMHRMGISGDAPRGPVVGRTLEALKDIAQIRYVIRDEGLAGGDRVLEAVRNMMREGWGKGIRDTYGSDVVRLGKEVLASPYKHPWSLTDGELTSAIGVLSERLRDSADQSVGSEVVSLFVELLPMGQRLKAGAGFALSAIGLSDSIDTATAQKAFWRLVNEAAYRKIITIDPRAAKSAGIGGLHEVPTGVQGTGLGGGSH
ncbi:MAG: hypothetical protein Kow00114_38840 [Kiloniellaceae bacterium]